MKKQLLNRKRLMQLFYSLSMILLCANSGWSQTVSTLPVYENFNYTVGSTIFPSATAAANTNGQGPWSTQVTLTKDATLIVASPSWANPGLSTSIGGAALQIKGSGADPQLLYTPKTAGFGAIYSSFAMSVTDQAKATVQATGAGGYFYGIASPTSKRAAVYLRFTEALKYQIGISTSTSSTAGITDWCPTILSVGDKNFVVVKYTESGEAFLFVNPIISQNQPKSGYQKSTEIASAVLPDRIYINANSDANTPQIVIDEIRIANTWSESIGGPATTPTASPIAEKRQVFASSSNPTVANLVAVGTGNLNWYSNLTGSVLQLNTPINSGNYYVTQTINGVESDPVTISVFVGDTSIKKLPLYEPFNYTVGDQLIIMKNGADVNLSTNEGIGLSSWSITPSTNITADIGIVSSPNWSTTVLPSPNAVGSAAISFVGSGVDPELEFTDTTSGSLYSSFVFSAVDPNDGKTPPVSILVASTTTDANYSTPTGFYSFLSQSTDQVTNVVTSSYAADVMFRKNIATGKFNLGLSKSNSVTECVWSPTEFDFGTQHLIVIGYENIGDATSTNQIAKLWIDPDTAVAMPSVTLSQDTPTTSVSRDHINKIKLLQASSTSTPTLVIDEIRVANNWGQALGGASTLGLSSQVASKSQCTVYPNPVSNGKLYISSPSSSEKQVSIFSILGQKVLDAKTTNNAEINVSKLAKGNYILKITEDGKSEAKKLIVQ